MTYDELAALLATPKYGQSRAISKRAHDIERVIAEGVLGAVLDRNHWEVVRPDGTVQRRLGLFENDGEWHAPNDFYRPLTDAEQALDAMDEMIGRGWSFQPQWNGADFSMVEVFHFGKELYARANVWSLDRSRHAKALTLAVALAYLIEKKL